MTNTSIPALWSLIRSVSLLPRKSLLKWTPTRSYLVMDDGKFTSLLRIRLNSSLWEQGLVLVRECFFTDGIRSYSPAGVHYRSASRRCFYVHVYCHDTRSVRHHQGCR